MGLQHAMVAGQVVPMCFAAATAGRFIAAAHHNRGAAAPEARPRLAAAAQGAAIWSAGQRQAPGRGAPGLLSAAAAGAIVAAAATVRRRHNLGSKAAWRHRGTRSKVARAAEDKMVSPFDNNGVAGAEKPKLPLTLENVEMVLDELRPYLRSDGGDCKVVEIDGPIVRLELVGSCSSCSASSVTLKMGIERTLAQRIPEIAEVVAVMPNQEPLSQEGIEEVLNGIRPFLSVSGGSIELKEMVDGKNGTAPQIVLQMAGPPLKSMAVRVEVVNRMKRKYPLVQDVEIVAATDNELTSA